MLICMGLLSLFLLQGCSAHRSGQIQGREVTLREKIASWLPGHWGHKVFDSIVEYEDLKQAIETPVNQYEKSKEKRIQAYINKGLNEKQAIEVVNIETQAYIEAVQSCILHLESLVQEQAREEGVWQERGVVFGINQMVRGLERRKDKYQTKSLTILNQLGDEVEL